MASFILTHSFLHSQSESPLLRRLLSRGAVVLLFVRVEGGREGYTPFGRLQAHSCDVAAQPVAVLWELLDHAQLATCPQFQRILALQLRGEET